ncbi:hypothetical protein SY27_01730 [Flavobacterium sp. 316]|uniref:hypothetical protein n=1 Tax=Flavobacterium sp. 316 TaxID=1603293 RepID=UPI0005DDDD5A|nr:hypothetical protein [Flavobacterium sp. 316]KIX22579.1 hypothetical protein SY27_01730 [Flavobacterium sp. 316]
MKKITQLLVIAVLSLGFSSAKASEKKVFDDVNRIYPPVDYRFAEPIVFMERGIEFYVFPNGELDFNTVETTSSGIYSRRNVNRTYGAPGVRTRGNTYYNSPRNNGTKIEHDYMGRVRRVGNVFINYDSTGRVKRIGSVYMRYNSFALSQIGGLRIMYDRHGCIIDIVGFVNASNRSNSYQSNNHYQATNHYEYGNGSNDNENDYYYYRQDGTKTKMSKEDIKELKK